MAKAEFKPGDKVELANKDIGFYDHQTGFKIVRDQQLQLGKNIGEKTQTALMSGGLLVVSSKKSAKPKANKESEKA